MTSVIITTNAPLVEKDLENLAAEIPEISRSRIWGRAKGIQRRIQNAYPPPVPTYTRTRRLKESVTVERNDDGYTISVDPVDDRGVHYAIYPLGSFGVAQAWMHIGRWPRLQDIVDQELDQLPQEIEDAISTFWKE